MSSVRLPLATRHQAHPTPDTRHTRHPTPGHPDTLAPAISIQASTVPGTVYSTQASTVPRLGQARPGQARARLGQVRLGQARLGTAGYSPYTHPGTPTAHTHSCTTLPAPGYPTCHTTLLGTPPATSAHVRTPVAARQDSAHQAQIVKMEILTDGPGLNTV